jgi:hypothetical protein
MEQRIAALERANRHLRMAVIVLFALTVARLIVPASARQASVPDVVRAGRFEVIRDGKTMGSLGADVDGGNLDIQDKNEKLVGYFGAMKTGGAELAMGGTKGNRQLYINADDRVATTQVTVSARAGGPSITLEDGCFQVVAGRATKFSSCR